MSEYLIGQQVILNNKEIGIVVKSETGVTHGIWVHSPSKGYASDYALHNVKPLPIDNITGAKTMRERKLKPECQERVELFEFEYDNSGCSCHLAAPCAYCTHPDNPANIAEEDECWEKEEQRQ